MKNQVDCFYSPYMYFINGEINDEVAERVIEKMRKNKIEWDEKGIPLNEREHIFLINSPGGSTTAGWAIYDSWSWVDEDIVTIVVGLSASMGSILSSGGTKGKRFALPNSEFMIHQPLGGAQGQATDIEIQANRIKSVKKRINTILSENTGNSYDKIENDTDRDNFMTAEQALKYGIIDGIIKTKKKAKGED